VLPQRVVNAIYALRDERLDSLDGAASRVPRLAGLAVNTRSALDAKRGHATRAVVRADSGAALLDAQGAGAIALMVRAALLATSIAADDPAIALAHLERWDVDGTLGGSPLLHGAGLALLAEAHLRAKRPADAERLLDRADSVAAAADVHQSGAILNARALIALSRGDAATGLQLVQRAIDADFGLVRHSHRVTRALAYEALGRHREAAEDFEGLASSKGLFWMDAFAFPALVPYAHERAGAAWLAAGDTTRALQHLGAFTELWSEADSALQPRVRAARATIESLLRTRG
jgi:tetratricopeptide (TPR) repeat protein